MALQTLTLSVPEALHRRLRERAEQSHRSMEEETLDVLGAAVPDAALVSPDLEEALAPLRLLDDESLWRAARSQLAAEAAGRLADLHGKRQREGLTSDEEQVRESLVRQYERSMLVRAEAAAELRRRGHDVSSLVSP